MLTMTTPLLRILKTCMRQCLKLTPYELRQRHRADEHLEIPAATLAGVRLALAYYLASGRLVTFVQIGACDGLSGDAAHDFVMKGRMRAILVEPVEQSFQKLSQLYNNMPTVTTVRAAIGTHDGSTTIFKVKDGANTIDSYWSSQLASFTKAHLLKHGVPEDEIEAVRVPCLTLASLLAQCGVERADIVQIDTEGFDAEVVAMALDLPVLPECITFEHVHLTGTATRHLFDSLRKNKYVWIHDECNTLAFHCSHNNATPLHSPERVIH